MRAPSRRALAAMLSLAGLLASRAFVAPTRSLQPGRGAAEARTVMRGVYRRPEIPRTRPSGGGRNPLTFNRKPVLAYSVNDKDLREPSGSVLRRMWDMYEYPYAQLVAERQQRFRSRADKYRWTANWYMKLGKKKKRREDRLQLEEDWLQWMRTTGREMGLTEPVVFNGPPLAHRLSPEIEALQRQNGVTKLIKSKTEMDMEYRKGRFSEILPLEMEPGQWDQDPELNIFKYYRRPMHKFPIDVPHKFIGKTRYIRGLVY